MDQINVNAVEIDELKYGFKKILTATNALVQKGSAWTLGLESNVLGVPTGQTFTTPDAAVDAVYSAIHAQYQKQAA
jgi:hypothetical protein